MTWTWVFDGGRICLDLVNTMRDRARGGHELLAGPEALLEWLELAGAVDGKAKATTHDLARARELREAIGRTMRAVSAGRRPATKDVRVINTIAIGSPAPTPQLRFDRDGAPLRFTRATADPVTAALSFIAIDAIELFAEGPMTRVCAADDCGLCFVDASPKGNRQWCSMSRCGNRAKARAHYAKRKASVVLEKS